MFLGTAAALLIPRSVAFADDVDYLYDELGRLIRVTYNNGATIQYFYDETGNRTKVIRSATPPSTFTATIAITGTGPVNLRSLADTNGYTGGQNATVTFTLASGVTIAGSAGAPNGGVAIDSGVWPWGTFAISLALQISGVARGGGGQAGGGNGNAGGTGGDAIYCRTAMAVTVNAGGEVRGGGGGGGGGGAPNGAGGPGGGGDGGSGSAGSAGTILGGGAGGASAPGGGGNGRNGGTYGQNGVAGQSSFQAGGAGGVSGYAVRKNGNTVTVTNNGTITGAVG